MEPTLPGRRTYPHLSNVQPDQAGSYIVVVTNAYGSTNSVNALLTVNPPPPCTPPPSGLVGGGEGNADDSVSGNNGRPGQWHWIWPGEVAQAFQASWAGTARSTNAMPGLNQYPQFLHDGILGVAEGGSGEHFGNYVRFCRDIEPALRHLPQPRSPGSGRSGGFGGNQRGERVRASDVYLPSLLVYNATIAGWTHIAVV